LRGQDLNLRPSGYENAEGPAIALDLQGIVRADGSDACDGPTQNPAIPREPKPSDDSPDDSLDLLHVRALAVAGNALVGVNPKRAHELLEELIRLLETARPGSAW
jgi:hypothetical protein